MIAMILRAISMMIGGMGENDVESHLTTMFGNATQEQTKAAARYAFRAYELGSQAETLDLTTFGELPDIGELGDTIRVRLFIEPSGNAGGGGVTLDVVTIPGAGVGAVKSFGYEYAAEIASGNYRLGKRQGNAAGYESPTISIVAIFPGADNASVADRTNELLF